MTVVFEKRIATHGGPITVVVNEGQTRVEVRADNVTFAWLDITAAQQLADAISVGRMLAMREANRARRGYK